MHIKQMLPNIQTHKSLDSKWKQPQIPDIDEKCIILQFFPTFILKIRRLLCQNIQNVANPNLNKSVCQVFSFPVSFFFFLVNN